MKDQDAQMFAYASWMTKHGGFAKDMTLRDYLAAKAMVGLLTVTARREDKYYDENALAVLSYTVADAMLKARGDK